MQRVRLATVTTQTGRARPSPRKEQGRMPNRCIIMAFEFVGAQLEISVSGSLTQVYFAASRSGATVK